MSTGARLPRTVIALGLVSLFTDTASEMIFPLLGPFLAQRVAAAPLVLGVMEGGADLVAAAFKLWSGHFVDRARRFRPLIFLGYGLSALARPWMALVAAWWQPLLVRFTDRVGKGMRGTPRDALIALWVPKEQRARAFSFHRGMDHAGAALGAVVASALLWLGVSVDRVFLLSVVPGALGVLAVFFAKEPGAAPEAASSTSASVPERAGEARASDPGPRPAEGPSRVPRRLGWFLGPVTLFALANSSDAFILLLMSEQGTPPAYLPLAWLGLHVVKAGFSFVLGGVADRLGPGRVVLGGWFLYASAYAAFALSPSAWVTFLLLLLYGLYHAATEGAEKALLANLVHAGVRGRAFGLYHALSGVGALGAGLWFGALWTYSGPQTAFLLAAAVAVASALALRLGLRVLGRDPLPGRS